ncbi:MAG TPA: sodium:solute symporter, partial [Chitinophagaceae bacterium]|nr:sodium:solute symporter [Chitinophagaceae bacterium]
ILTLALILIYGIQKSRKQHNMADYFLGDREMPWYIVLFSIMATQASAITFLSAPGQAYTDGMRFVQYYFGLPIAMVVLCIGFVPIFRRLKVYTAYEFLETRFDLKTRVLASGLFLLQRGASTGISIYAPSIILSSLLGWNIYWTNIFMGGLLIIYTVLGGARAVAYTQQLQLFIIFAGMALAGWIVVHLLPAGISFTDALHVSGKLGKLNVIVPTIHVTSRTWWQDKYNIWSGTIGGFFLALSYFGTDQSQVGRYLTGKSLKESRMGLLLNGLIKIPMQFLILLIGALLFVFYLYAKAPVFFNDAAVREIYTTPYGPAMHRINDRFALLESTKGQKVDELVAALHQKNLPLEASITDTLHRLEAASNALHGKVVALVHRALPGIDRDDTNYIFLHFVKDYLPRGLVGLLIAVIFLATWGSTSATLNSLASTSLVDIHKRIWKKDGSPQYYLRASRWWTVFWGLFCIGVAQFAQGLGSLIEAVNVLGSLFYGTILGIFLMAFYSKKVSGTAVFWAAVVAEIGVIGIYKTAWLSFLWLNVVGCLLVIGIAWTLHLGKAIILNDR